MPLPPDYGYLDGTDAPSGPPDSETQPDEAEPVEQLAPRDMADHLPRPTASSAHATRGGARSRRHGR